MIISANLVVTNKHILVIHKAKKTTLLRPNNIIYVIITYITFLIDIFYYYFLFMDNLFYAIIVFFSGLSNFFLLVGWTIDDF